MRNTLFSLGAIALFAAYWFAITAAVNPTKFAATESSAVCGTERWPVKTLTDRLGKSVAGKKPVAATVSELTSFPARGKKELLHDEATRIAPQELTVYQVDAEIVGFKRETDSDIHIVIAGPKDPKDTMVAEIPAGACMSGAAQSEYTALQAMFEKQFGHATAKFKTLAKPVPVTIRGVGFFDFIHGQTGVAKNGFELHPVLGWQANGE